MYEGNGIETMIDKDWILWINEKHIEEGLDHKNFQEITIKYHSKHRQYRNKPDNKSRKQCNRIFVDLNLAMKETMGCRTTSALTFRTKSRFKQYAVILTKELSVLTKISSSLEEENMEKQ